MMPYHANNPTIVTSADVKKEQKNEANTIRLRNQESRQEERERERETERQTDRQTERERALVGTALYRVV